jgi:predicted enzyme related to lactoylglutathione lyase
MAARVGYLVIDTVDPEALAPFWCARLGVEITTRFGDGAYVVLGPTADGLTLAFQRVPEAKQGKNRLHLDLVVDDLDDATARAVGDGGWWDGEEHEMAGFRWRCLRDPEGNEFDLVPD